MKQQYIAFHPSIKHMGFFALFLLFSLIWVSCGTGNVLDRGFRPEVRAEVPVDSSEIREITFRKLNSEGGHEALHLTGQLFVKSTEGGSTRIRPCAGCRIRLTTTADTSLSANLTTLRDGYFEFNGKVFPYTLTLTNAGMNPLVLENIEMEREGNTIIRVINAAGNTPERFRLKKTGVVYSWDKVQEGMK
ncbi:MAG TPA: hypothetical protein VGE66_07805 [Chitinophagaceae bacterium]